MARGESKIGIVTEALSAAAVVISLVFVGLEVRESSRQTALNTQSMQVSAYQELIAQINSLNLAALENPVAADLFSSIETGPRYESLSDDARVELYTFDALLFLLFRHGDMAFYQYELGMLPADRLESAVRPLTCRLSSPKVQEMWTQASDNFSAAYREYIDSQISRGLIC